LRKWQCRSAGSDNVSLLGQRAIWEASTLAPENTKVAVSEAALIFRKQ
jgi:hypothetical protein